MQANYFSIKDQSMKKILLGRKCEGGLYLLKSSRSTSNKVTFDVIKSSLSRWHSRLGHPSPTVVCQVLSKNHIPFVSRVK